jgi:hypothetical protein
MPTITYLPIATTTVSGTSTNAVTFSSIPNTYTDLVLVQYLPGDPTATYAYSNLRYNSDTGNNYSSSYQYYYNGLTPGRQANVSYILHGTSSFMGNSNIITHIQNYSNTTNNKTSISRVNLSANSNGITQEIFEGTGLYRSTSAITSVTAFITTGNYASGSIFTLYGIL